jgi:hypothetical protein
MKILLGALALAVSFASLASTGESRTFNYDGSQNSIELLLRGEKTHTEYRYETRTTTCYRTEIAGYRSVCNGPYSRPGRYGGGMPHPGTCYQQPVYRQVAYPCSQTVQIPFEVKDYDVDARVIVDVTNLSAAMTPGEKIVVNLMGDNLSVSTVGSKKFFLMLKKQDIRSNMNGSVKFLDALYAIEMIEATPILKALNMVNISLENDVLSFDLGPISNRANLGFSLNVTKKKLFGSDPVLFDRELDSSEMTINSTSTASLAKIDVDKLGVSLEDGKFSLTAKAFFKAEGTLMNASQFGDDLEVSKTLIFKNR